MIEGLLKRVLRTSWRRAAAGGSPPWVFASALTLVAYLANRHLRRSEEVVWRHKLPVGESIEVSVRPPR